MGRKIRFKFVYFFVVCQFVFPLFTALPAKAGNSVCAKVKIEINQELTLERQAFDAHMRITNGLPRTDLENIKVNVWFKDEDGNPVEAVSDPDNDSASFYININEMDNIIDVSGSGVVSADTAADIHWLIIPAPGSSNAQPGGKKYNVGASLTYSVGGEEETVEVTPDYIYVKPMPELSLDYFLPEQVYGDDPFTSSIEASVPFFLGVRVTNSGDGSANQLKIESAQPKIIDNDQGLLIDFKILGSEVNGQAEAGGLIVDFGMLEPGKVANARWEMSCTLSGKFVDFTASYTHSDELGGSLTSLLNEVKTHTLVQCVMVDLPNRDSITDFLSRSGDTYTVFESETVDTRVENLTDQAALALLESTSDVKRHALNIPSSNGFVYACLPDPYNGTKILDQVIRSDGKQIKSENAWFSKTQDSQTHEWSYFINIFDVDTTGSYTLSFADAAASPQAPVIQLILDKTVSENQHLSFIVEASDPNGTQPALSATPLPAGAVFSDSGDGTGIFDWTPATGQAGTYNIIFTASDGSLSSAQSIKIIVFNAGDTDMDGLNDAWELKYFNTLSRDGSGDFDGDGVTDAQECSDDTDPTCDESVPSVPVPLFPHQYINVADTDITIVVEKSVHAHDDEIRYQFELYADEQCSTLLAAASQNEISTTDDWTSWQIPVTLDENTRYYWRARSVNNFGASLWVYRSFFVNRENDPPGALSISGPADDTGTDSVCPVLEVMNATDPDGDELTYTFEIFADEALEEKVVSSGPVTQGDAGTTCWQVTRALTDTNYYFWCVTAQDKHGSQSYSPVAGFFVNTEDNTPTMPVILSPGSSEETNLANVELSVENTQNLGDDPVEYYFEVDCMQSFDSACLQASEAISSSGEVTTFRAKNLGENMRYFWRVKVCDSDSCSPWTSSQFFVNTINEAPDCPMVKNPGKTSWTRAEQPVLSVFPVVDPDQDSLEYQFEIYNDQNLSDLVYQTTSILPDWTLPVSLENNRQYYWRARAQDEHGVSGAWTDVHCFFLKTTPENLEPCIEIALPYEDLATNASSITIKWFDRDFDDNALISLFYATNDQGGNATLIAENIQENSEGEQDSYVWDISDMDDGIYYLYAQISDGDAEFVDYSPVSMTIDRTPPVPVTIPESGEYDAPLEVEITSSETSDIYYTLDGTDPGPGSNLYDAPLVLTQSTVLKCRAIDPAGNSSDIITREYSILPENITFNLTSGSGTPIANVKIHLFTESGKYKRISRKTNANGICLFNPNRIPEGLYKFRIDWLGQKFWTDTIALPETRVIEKNIPVETVLLDLQAAGLPVSGKRVYLFSQAGSYLGVYQLTDEQGQISFDLPTGIVYKFRTDILGSRYWSDPVEVIQGESSTVSLDTGGGVLTVTLQKDELTPMPNIMLYLYSASGKYLSKKQKTSEDGKVSFTVPGAEYKIKTGYLGYTFWTDSISVEENTQLNFTIPHESIVVTVSSSYQETLSPIENIRTYLFSGAGSYLKKSYRTDSEGKVYLSLPDREYKLRADFMQQKFWSLELNHSDIELTIPMAKSVVTVTGAGRPKDGLNVNLFSESGKNLKQVRTTDSEGQADFDVPEGSYKFRTSYSGNQFWSPVSALAADVVSPVGISVGGGKFTFTGLINSDQPLSGVKTYVYTDNKKYAGLKTTTDTQGEAFFDLGDGNYYFRLNYMGSQYWSDLVCVPDQLSYSLSIPHEILQAQLSTHNQALSDNRLYLFSQAGKYLGLYKNTDQDGLAQFTIPVGLDVKLRTDALGNRFWSDAITITNGETNYLDFNLGGGAVRVCLTKDNETPIANTKIDLFASNGKYTQLSSQTDSSGHVFFEVPEAWYKFRANYMGHKFWASSDMIYEDTTIGLTIPHGEVEIIVSRNSTPIKGARVCLFKNNKLYLRQYLTTDSEGRAVFSIPADRTFKFRVTVGKRRRYWSRVVTPDSNHPTTIEMDIAP